MLADISHGLNPLVPVLNEHLIPSFHNTLEHTVKSLNFVGQNFVV